MALIFITCLCSLAIWLPLHFISVNHKKLNAMFEEEIAKKVGTISGLISGWGYFISLMGLWVSPQPNLIIPIVPVKIAEIPLLNIPLYLMNMISSCPFIILSIYLGIAGVKGTTLEVSETHRPKEVITEDVYSKIRHPQYMGAIMAHMGFSLLFSGLYAFLSIPIIILYNYVIAWKEEQELIKEFGNDYIHYKRRVPMFIPKVSRLRKQKSAE